MAVLAWGVLLDLPALATLDESSLECSKSSVKVNGLRPFSWSSESMSEMGNEDVCSSSVRSMEGWRAL